MSTSRMRATGIACVLGALVAAMIAFGAIKVWSYDTDASYQAYVDGRAVGGVRSGADLVSTNNSTVSVLIIPLLVTGVSLLRTSRKDDVALAEASSAWPATAIVGGVGALVAYAGFFAQFVEEGDLWLGNPLVVMWFPVVIMVAVFFLLKLPSGSGPQTEDTARQGLIAALVICAVLTALMLALMAYGVNDGFIPVWVAISVSLLMLGMTAAVGLAVAKGPRRR